MSGSVETPVLAMVVVEQELQDVQDEEWEWDHHTRREDEGE